MRKLASRTLCVLILLLGMSLPAGAEECKVCNTHYDPGTMTALVSCDRAIDDQMGFWGCEVQCDGSSCGCTQNGPPIYCMTIVVQG